MTDASSAHSATAEAVFSRGGLMLADGTFFEGVGFGAPGSAIGEVCFNTAMTGYQEILSDPSYAGQIVAFTFPHIGIVGTNDEDIETITPAVRQRPPHRRRRPRKIRLPPVRLRAVPLRPRCRQRTPPRDR